MTQIKHNAGGTSGLNVSFEFFPPKTETMEQTLWTSIGRLAPLAPHFVSVTYGAGGSTRERTHATLKRILTETNLHPAAHLTCVGATREDLDGVVDRYAEIGVSHIVALRGDPETGLGTPYVPTPGGYGHAGDLVGGDQAPPSRRWKCRCRPMSSAIRRAPTGATELDNLKRKVDAGADRAITQFFFDNDMFDAFRERLAAARIDIPLVPGIVPVTNFTQTARFAVKAGASVPAWLAERFAGLEDDPGTRQLIAAAVASEQVLDLVERGVTDFHFYTMNRADLVYAICHLLGIRPPKPTPTEAAA